MSPTARSLQYLREQGFVAEVVERWIPFAKVRKDFLGIIDILAVKDGEQGVLGIQATTTGNLSAREAKARANAVLPVWMRCGNRFQLWGWSLRGGKGERKVWKLERRGVDGSVLAMVGDVCEP